LYREKKRPKLAEAKPRFRDTNFKKEGLKPTWFEREKTIRENIDVVLSEGVGRAESV